MTFPGPFSEAFTGEGLPIWGSKTGFRREASFRAQNQPFFTGELAKNGPRQSWQDFKEKPEASEIKTTQRFQNRKLPHFDAPASEEAQKLQNLGDMSGKGKARNLDQILRLPLAGHVAQFSKTGNPEF